MMPNLNLAINSYNILRQSIIIILITLSSVVALATDYDVLKRKANLFYEQQEWLSASAMYTLMLDRHPDITDTYSHAIIAASMRNDSLMQAELLDKAFQNHIPFDSLYNQVKSLSFNIGKTNLYENFLLRTQISYPWLSRNIDLQLLKYYTFRRNGNKMEHYALKMLKNIEDKPESIPFRDALAEAYLLQGRQPEAIDTFMSIIKLDADNYNAIIELGNCYYTSYLANKENSQLCKLAQEYLSKAYSLKPTPFVKQMLESLKTPTK